MFGFRGGESESTLARLTGYRADAQQKWPTLTYLDLSQIKNEAQLVSKIGERYSLPPAQAQADVTAWMAGKTFYHQSAGATRRLVSLEQDDCHDPLCDPSLQRRTAGRPHWKQPGPLRGDNQDRGAGRAGIPRQVLGWRLGGRGAGTGARLFAGIGQHPLRLN